MICDDNGNVAITNDGKYFFFGGGTEENETALETLNREMIEETGLGIAMGNAVPELKSVAKYITTNIEEEGITAACKHFNYIKD